MRNSLWQSHSRPVSLEVFTERFKLCSRAKIPYVIWWYGVWARGSKCVMRLLGCQHEDTWSLGSILSGAVRPEWREILIGLKVSSGCMV